MCMCVCECVYIDSYVYEGVYMHTLMNVEPIDLGFYFVGAIQLTFRNGLCH